MKWNLWVIPGALLLAIPVTGMADLLQPSDLTYLGAFAVPLTNELGGMASPEGQGSLSYRPDGDPSGSGDGYPGSLILASHGYVAEISIPAPIKTANLSDLNSAQQLQATNQITAGAFLGSTDRLGGVAYVPAKGSQTSAKLYWSMYEYYNVSGEEYPSLGYSDVTMSAPHAQGAWHVGDPANGNWDSGTHSNKYGDYIIPIDQAWADQNLGGRSLLVGRFREAGCCGGSMGPVLTAVAPWQDGNPPASGTNLSAIPLMYFNTSTGHSDLSWMKFVMNNDPDFMYYSDGDHWNGGAWVQAGNKRAIIMVGRHGTYNGVPMCPKTNYGDGCGGGIGTTASPWCYGVGGIDCPYPIAVTNYKGFHNGPYVPRFLFINPDDLAAVAQGTKAHDDVSAYTVYDPSSDWPWKDVDNLNDVAGAAYDSVNSILYVIQAGVNEPGGLHTTPWPVIQVYKVNGGGTATPPETTAQSVYNFDDMTVNANSPALPQSSADWNYVPNGTANLDAWQSTLTGDAINRYQFTAPGDAHIGYPWYGFLEIDNQVAIKGNSLKVTITGGYNGTYSTSPGGLAINNKAEYLANTQPYTNAIVGNPYIYFPAKGFHPNNNPIATPFSSAAGATQFTLYAKAPAGSTVDLGSDHPQGTWQLGPYSKCPTCFDSGHFYNTFFVGGDGWVKLQMDNHADWHNSGYTPPRSIPDYVSSIHGFYVIYGDYDHAFMTPDSYWLDEMQFETDSYGPQNQETLYDLGVGYEPGSNTWQIGFNDKYGNNNGGAMSSYQIRYAFAPITNENWDSARPGHILAYPHFGLEDRTDGSFQKPGTYAYRSVWAKFQLASAADDARFQSLKHIYFAVKDISQDPNNLQKINPALTGAMAGQGRDYAGNPTLYYDYTIDANNLPYIKRIDYVLPGANVSPGGPLPAPTLNLPSYLPVNGNITAGYPAGYNNISFQWTITPKDSSSNIPSPKTAAPGRALGATTFSTPGTTAGLVSRGLAPGLYTITVRASNGTATSDPASQDVTLVAADFSGLRVFPNPWRSDKHTGKSITFDGLPLGSTIKLFTVSGHWIKTLTPAITAATWDLANDSGQKVASGDYLYLITVNGSNDKKRGQVVVIK